MTPIKDFKKIMKYRNEEFKHFFGDQAFKPPPPPNVSPEFGVGDPDLDPPGSAFFWP